MKPQHEKFKIVRISWKDAKSIQSLDHCDVPQSLELAPYIAAGFKIAESKEALVICQGILPACDKFEEPFYKAVLTIPKALITKVEEFEMK